jgi:phospho-N-acetylmuramoyl-pentapeptide-transferase
MPLPTGEKRKMLLELAKWLATDVRALNVFNYITLRAVLATMTALAISFVAGPAVIRWLTARKIGQAVRSDGPQTHLIKAGTPTMGGALILISLGISTLLWADLTNRFVWIVLVVTLGYGAVGWVDDWRKVVYRDPKGLSAKSKLLLAIDDRFRRCDLYCLLDFGPQQRESRRVVLSVGRQRIYP